MFSERWSSWIYLFSGQEPATMHTIYIFIPHCSIYIRARVNLREYIPLMLPHLFITRSRENRPKIIPEDQPSMET